MVAKADQEKKVAQAMELVPAEALEARGSARAEGLALLLDDGTRKSHSVAENTAFVTGFFSGIATKKSFAKLVCSLFYVYGAMEAAFDEATDASVKALDYPELRRRESLERDMVFYFGADASTWPPPSTATAAYVARIERISREEPPLLVAHMYTRYLGDLFGGQMMGGMARRSLGLPQGSGTAFYNFDAIPSTKEFIEAWYQQLNQLTLTEAQKQAVVDEGNAVFALNIDVFGELEGSPAKALWKLAYNQLRRALRLTHTP